MDQIRSIGVEPTDRTKASAKDYGALRRRLKIVTRHSTELFVINSVQQAVATLHEMIPGLADNPGDHVPPEASP
jgi:hypothetical protein